MMLALSGDAPPIQGVALPFRPGSEGSILSQELARAFNAAAADTLGSLDALRDTICLYVEKERERGASVDLVTANIRAMLHRANTRLASDSVGEGIRDEAITSQVLKWCAQFYEGPVS
jgi:hypothetical protein